MYRRSIRNTRRVDLDEPDFHLDAGDRLDVAVYVTETAADLRRLARQVGGWPVPRGLVGVCWGARGPGAYADRRTAAIVALAKPLLGVGYVAHELAHATYRVLEARDLKVRHWTSRGSYTVRKRSPEERYCLTLERLCAGFWREAYRRQLA